MNTKHTPQIWHANLDRVFSWITIPDGTRNPPIVARDLSEEDCTSIVHTHNTHAALVAALDNCLKELDFIFPPGGPYITAQVEARALLADEVGK